MQDTYDFESDSNKNDNPNWQFVGKLKDVTVFNKGNQVFSWIKTNTTFFAIEGILDTPVHAGQTVKLSKRDNAAKIGAILVYRPDEQLA